MRTCQYDAEALPPTLTQQMSEEYEDLKYELKVW